MPLGLCNGTFTGTINNWIAIKGVQTLLTSLGHKGVNSLLREAQIS